MWPNLQFPADLVTYIEEILNGKLHFLCSEISCNHTSRLGDSEKKHENKIKNNKK